VTEVRILDQFIRAVGHRGCSEPNLRLKFFQGLYLKCSWHISEILFHLFYFARA